MSPLRSAVREVDETGTGGGAVQRGRSGARPSPSPAGRRRPLELEQGRWADLPPELLLDVMRRVEVSEASWPARSHVVACAAVCRSWREAVKEVVGSPEICGRITFPVSLKQPGPRDKPIQCFIRRERKTGTFHLYLGLSPALQAENGKLLLSARKVRRATSTDYMISLASNNFSRTSSSYIGKLRPNFLGTKFTLYDSQPPCDSAVTLNRSSTTRVHPKHVFPNVPAGRYKVATISYEVSVLQTRGPRRMHCTMHSIPTTVIQEGGAAPTPSGSLDSLDQQFSDLSLVKPRDPAVSFSSTSLVEPPKADQTTCEPLFLKNKAPRWHEQLQCWCLNFRGRVTVASVKNFQLVVAVDPSRQVPLAEQERVILQFGKIGKDIFTMDYQYPLSAFQAFAICLSSFDNKPLRE